VAVEKTTMDCGGGKKSFEATMAFWKGYLIPDNYYFPELEKRHYYSRILKFVITIFNFPQISTKYVWR
jgi:hypothetical protein